MAYFDGGIHGWNGPNGYVPAKPNTRILCDKCGETELPLKPEGQIGRHWETGFKWAPHYGAPCHACGTAC
jgi:hypothetical protein